MGFKLVRVDATEPCKIPLAVGHHYFGRGRFLDCEDNRVSRNHGVLIVTENTVHIKSLHQNPCFHRYKPKANQTVSQKMIILHQNVEYALSNGDQFGLLPESHWYELVYCNETVTAPHKDYTPQPIKDDWVYADAVRIYMEHTEKLPPLSGDIASAILESHHQTDKSTTSPYKRPHSGDSIETGCKKVKTEPQNNENQGINPESQLVVNSESQATRNVLALVVHKDKPGRFSYVSESVILNYVQEIYGGDIRELRDRLMYMDSKPGEGNQDYEKVLAYIVHCDKSEQNIKTVNTESNNETVETDPKTEPINPEPSIGTVKTEPNIEPVNPKPNIGTVNPEQNILTVKTEPKFETVNPEPNMESVKTEPNIETVKTEPNIETVKTEPNIEPVNSKPNIETVNPEPNMETVKTEPNFETVKAEPNIESLTAEPNNNNVKTEANSQDNVKPGPSNVQLADGPAAGSPAANAADKAPAPTPAPAAAARPRERCKYGPQCYRINAVHKARFSHPSDADWATATPPAPPRNPGPGVRMKRVKKWHRRRSDSDSDDSSGPVLTRTRNAGVANKKMIMDESDSEGKDPFASDDTDDWVPSDD